MKKVYVVSEVWSDFGREKYNILGAATDYEKAREYAISNKTRESATWCVDEVELID
ncbi:MAG: hypothetical protein ACOC8S_07435 [Bacteroidota bacterium]